MKLTNDDMLIIGLACAALVIVLAVEHRIQNSGWAVRRREAHVLRQAPGPARQEPWLRPGMPLTRMEKCDFAGLVEAYNGADAEPDRWLP